MKITWEDISSNIVYSKLTGVEPNPIYKEIYDHLQYWIPSIIPDTRVTINNKYSYIYNSKTKYLWIDFKNMWSVLKYKYDIEYPDIQSLIIGCAVSSHNIEVKHTNRSTIKANFDAVSSHNIEVKHTVGMNICDFVSAVSSHNIEAKYTEFRLN